MKKTEGKLKVAKLVHADWNPRSPAELAWDNPEMASLIDSVRAVGVIQPIAVWIDPPPHIMIDPADGVVIAGNRRLEAAKAAGLEEVPVLKFSDISEAQARMITRIENEVRLGVDPLKDASLIGSMLGLGYSQKEIAAHFGVSEAKICRRRKLLDLIPKIREVAEKGDCNITIDALEQIAAYPREIQERCTSDVLRRAKGSSTPMRWNDLSYIFARETNNLDDAAFDCEECKLCIKRTGAQPDLWGDTAEDGKLGKCFDKKCFERKVREHALEQLRRKVGKKVELIDGEANGIASYYQRPDDGTFTTLDGKRDAKHPACWYWFYYGDTVNHCFGPTLKNFQKQEAAREAEEAMRAEEEAATKEARAAEAQERAAIVEARNKLAANVREAEVRISDQLTKYLTSDDVEGAYSFIVCNLFGFVKNNAQRVALAQIFAKVVGECYGYDEELAELCVAFPKFAKLAKVSQRDLDAYTKAKAALDAFDLEHKTED